MNWKFIMQEKSIHVGRREAVVGLASMALGASGFAPMANAQTTPSYFITGYTDKESYVPGESVVLYLSAMVSTTTTAIRGPLPVNVFWNLYDTLDNTIKATGTITVSNTYTETQSGDQAWASDGSIVLPGNLTSGCYYFEFAGIKNKNTYIVVREPARASLAASKAKPADLVVVIPTWTMQAYNFFGNGSAYAGRGKGIQRYLSLARPYGDVFYERWLNPDLNKVNTTSMENWRHAMGPICNWLRREFNCTFVCDADLHFNTDELLRERKCVVFIGQNEYWTDEMRATLEAYLNIGGHMANLAGCTQWWRSPYNPTGRILDFSSKIDLVGGRNIRWHTQTPAKSAKLLFGTGFEHGAFNNQRLPSLDATVYNHKHWLYDDSGVRNYSTFGNSLGLAPYEVDGVQLVWTMGDDNVRQPTVAPNWVTPSSFVVLATSDLTNVQWDKPANPSVGGVSSLYNWTIGLFNTNSGGRVFSSATVHWGAAFTDAELAKTPQNVAIHMTRNFLRSCAPLKTLQSVTREVTALYEHRSDFMRNNTFRYTYHKLPKSASVAWTPTHAALFLANKGEPGAVPLFRFHRLSPFPGQPGRDFLHETLSTDRTLQSQGWSFGHTVGYAFTTQRPGTRPVYSYLNKRYPNATIERLTTRQEPLDYEEFNGIRFYVY
jgi:hypothetical protein